MAATKFSTGEIRLRDHATAHVGDYISHVENYISSDKSEDAKRKTFLKRLAFENMNEKRNQIRKTENVEWIWGSSLSNLSSQDISLSGTEAGKRYERGRIELSCLWGFDSQNDDIWEVIVGELSSQQSEVLSHAINYLDPGFSIWLTGETPIFWIYGKPASGKSTLMKYLSDNPECVKLLEQSSNTNWQLLHFFFDYRAKEGVANSMAGMFKTFLFQLIQKIPGALSYFSAHPIMKDLDVPHNEQSVEQLQTVFQSYLVDTDAHVCIFVDGLDEFTGSLPVLTRILKSLADGVHIKMCVASRPETAVRNALKDVPCLKMQNYNHVSIVRFTTELLRDAADFGKDPISFWKLIANIVGQASGVILWADLVCVDVCDGLLTQETSQELTLRIETYPSELDDVYSRLLGKLDQRFGAETSITLYLLLSYSQDTKESDVSPPIEALQHILEILRDCGYLPLFPHENMELPAFQIRLLARLGGLIDVVRQYNFYGSRPVIRPIHRTLVSYLTSTGTHERFLPSNFLLMYPDHVWLRIYCTYIAQTKLFDSWPLDRMFELGILWRGNEVSVGYKRVNMGNVRADARLLRETRQNPDRPQEWDAESENELSRLLLACSQSLCRAQIALRNPGAFHIIKNTLIAEARRLHCFYLCCATRGEEKFVLNCSNDEYALAMCFAYSLWEHARIFDETISYSVQLRAICAKIILALSDYYTSPETRILPQPLSELDFWIEKIAEDVNVIDLVIAQFAPYGLGLRTPKGTLISRFVARRSPRAWKPVTILKHHDPLRNYIFMYEVWTMDEPNNKRFWIEHIDSLAEVWDLKFTVPLPSWMYDSGVSCLFTLVMALVRPGDFTADDTKAMLEWIDLLAASGQDLGSFCYPTGTILHLLIECLPLRRSTIILAQGLVERGIDVSIAGPKGTALDIARGLPSSRSNLFDLKFYKEGAGGVEVASRAESDSIASRYVSFELRNEKNVKGHQSCSTQQDLMSDLIKLLESAITEGNDNHREIQDCRPLELWLKDEPHIYKNEDTLNGRTVLPISEFMSVTEGWEAALR